VTDDGESDQPLHPIRTGIDGTDGRFCRQATSVETHRARPLQERPPMTYELELDDELGARIERHLEDDETPEEFVAELLSVYETEGSFPGRVPE